MNPTKYRIKVSIENEMLNMLRICIPQLPDETAKEVSELVGKAEKIGFKNKLI
jgi:hypothetical protein